MKRMFTVILAVVFFLTPALCFSAYVIHLKDGRQFTTGRYWEDGDQIKFERFGGEIGIPRNRIKAIEEVKLDPEQEAPIASEPPLPATPPEPEQETEPPKKGEDSGKSNPLEPNPESEKQAFIHQYRKAYDVLVEKFKKAPMMGKEELYQYVDELIAFKKGILSDRLADTFSVELQEVYSMLDEVEDILRLKNH